MNKDETRKRALTAIDLIGLDGLEGACSRELSGGIRQRVGFARDMIVDPTNPLIDERFSALDMLTGETLRRTSSRCGQRNTYRSSRPCL